MSRDRGVDGLCLLQQRRVLGSSHLCSEAVLEPALALDRHRQVGVVVAPVPKVVARDLGKDLIDMLGRVIEPAETEGEAIVEGIQHGIEVGHDLVEGGDDQTVEDRDSSV